MSPTSSHRILDAYHLLLRRFGSQGWWPLAGPDRTGRAEKKPLHVPKHHNGPPLSDEDMLEIMVGAILTQNTSWTNVEKAILNLHKKHLLSFRALDKVNQEKLAGFIRSAGYFNQKAMKIKELCNALKRVQFNELKGASLNDAREFLLSVKGIGPETADSIVLYALEKPAFVVDAYTRRVFVRLGIISGSESYDEIRSLFEKSLPAGISLFKEYHALIVRLGKDVCRKNPKCHLCPLESCSLC
ncbi:MAG: hypothetical protein ABIJ21_09045 [Nanoarchaeota archaeon]